MIKEWDVLDSRVDRDFRVFRVRIDRAVSPRTGSAGEFYTLESKHWVNVIPVTADNQIVMITQYRHGSREVTLEIPGGLVDESDPGQAAVRELAEETGYSGDGPEYLGCVNPNPAIFNNLCYTYLVRNAVKSADTRLEADEDIDVVLVPVNRVQSLIADGTISHALVVVAFHFYFLREAGRLRQNQGVQR